MPLNFLFMDPLKQLTLSKELKNMVQNKKPLPKWFQVLPSKLDNTQLTSNWTTQAWLKKYLKVYELEIQKLNLFTNTKLYVQIAKQDTTIENVGKWNWHKIFWRNREKELRSINRRDLWTKWIRSLIKLTLTQFKLIYFISNLIC